MRLSDDTKRLKYYDGAGRYPSEVIICYLYQTRYEAYHDYSSKNCTIDQRDKSLGVLSLLGDSKI